MSLLTKEIIKQGYIIDNYLVDFPQYITKEENSIYKLEINDGSNSTILQLDIPLNNISISLDIIGTDYIIDWGDSNRNDNTTHTYSKPGIYNICINGEYDYFNNLNDNFKKYLIEIIKLGNKLKSLKDTFKDCINLIKIPNQQLSDSIIDCSATFKGCIKLTCIPEEFILSPYCTTTKQMFMNTSINEIENENFALPPSIIDCSYMFYNTNIKYIPHLFFSYCYKNLQNMDYCFAECTKLINIESFNPYNLISLTGLISVFENDKSIIKTNDIISIPNNIIDISNLFKNCINLLNIGSFNLHSNMINVSGSFYNCKNIKNDIRSIIPYNLKDDCNLIDTFYNCHEIKGLIPAWNLWKAKNYKTLSSTTDAFYNCQGIDNYRTILSSWGGPESIPSTDAYSYLELKISKNEDDNSYVFFALPINKWINYTNKPKQLANYFFSINYGDSDIWYDVFIDNKYLTMWIDNPDSLLYGYPKTFNVIYKNAETDNPNKMISQQEQQYQYEKIISENQHGFLLQNLIHKYERSGTYIITIKGNIDTFYINEQDVKSWYYLTKIISVEHLGLKTLNHAFFNTYKLEYIIPQFIKKGGLTDQEFKECFGEKSRVKSDKSEKDIYKPTYIDFDIVSTDWKKIIE